MSGIRFLIMMIHGCRSGVVVSMDEGSGPPPPSGSLGMVHFNNILIIIVFNEVLCSVERLE